jgi:hypothetical protein
MGLPACSAHVGEWSSSNVRQVAAEVVVKEEAEQHPEGEARGEEAETLEGPGHPDNWTLNNLYSIGGL